MTNMQVMDNRPLRIFGWAAAAVLLLTGVWLAVGLPLLSMVFGQIIPGVIALIAGFAVMVVLRRSRLRREHRTAQWLLA